MKTMNKVARWTAPPENDVRVLGMPNIPKPLHGQSMQPRTIETPSTWNKMRLKCYEKAGYKCEICGYEHEKPADLHAHEVFSVDYSTGESKFERLICLCVVDHLLFIHSGRALTMYKKGVYTAQQLLDGAEHGFKLISEYNKTHKDKIKVYGAMRDYLKEPELKGPMQKLIDKYGIEFYSELSAKKTGVKWSDWKMIYEGNEYHTPYKDEQAWADKMEELNQKEHRGETKKRMSGGIFDEIDKLLKEENETKN